MAESLLSLYFQVLMQVQALRRSTIEEEKESDQVLLVNRQFPEDASEMSEYQTTFCMCFPEMPEHLL